MINLADATSARKGKAAVLRCDNPFWKFSLAVYAQPGVAAECLALQSALNIDVNALLFCAWLGADKKIILNETNLDAAEACARRWHGVVVRPLRTIRQAMKPMPDMADDAVKALRKDIAAVELRAEQIEQALLFDEADTVAAGATPASAEHAVTANVTAFVQRNATGAAEIPPARLLIAAAITYPALSSSKTIEK